MMNERSGERPKLKRTLGRVEVFALSFGTMVAWGAVALPVQWIESGGILGTVVSIIITTIMCAFVGMIYAELTSTFPLAGAELAFSYRAMGMPGAWITGWMICLAYLGIAVYEAIALSMALSYLFPLPHWGYITNVGGVDVYMSWVIPGMIGALTLTVLNIIGIRRVAIFQALLVLIMLFTGVFYIFSALAFGEANSVDPIVTDIDKVETVFIMIPSMFIGFDMVSKSAEEMNMPLRSVSRILIPSICLTGIWYIALTLATYFLLPNVSAGAEINNIADVAGAIYHSDVIMRMIIVGGICGIITTWNGFITGASRIIFSMSRANMLPGIFKRVHPKYQTPIASILFVGILCCFAPVLGTAALDPTLHIVSFSAVISYLMVSISFLLIKKNEPDIRTEYKIKNEKLAGNVAIVCVLLFLFWYTPISPVELNWNYEWFMIFAWVMLGILFFVVFKIRESKNKVTPSERELLIFGDEYAREFKI